MSARTATELYEEMKCMTVEERIRFFSLSLAEVHRELQESIAQIESMQHALAESELNHRQLVETAQDAVITIDLSGQVINWNHAAERMFGWRAEESIGSDLSDMIIPQEFREQHKRGLMRFQASQPSTILNRTIEIMAMHRVKGQFPIELSIWPHQQSGKQLFSAFIRDITDRKQREHLAWLHANFDTLTGLPNRRLLVNRLEQAITLAISGQKNVALLFIDLDRFKPVNDTYGHSVGDELLRLVGFRLQSCLHEEDTLARLGGDEFVALLPDLNNDDMSLQPAIDSMTAALSQSFLINDIVISISGSIGVAVFPRDAQDADSLLNCADKAMYTAKKTV
ncbi:diguanylate cyclase domain-containing protein [[Enterobacter] lignolyticus]|uniref:Diguanylate cyclase with PAS/PAC sensor n=1 Tax=Enterobacter lignolyticus (strain SCF1) TaxID=701347 RepID=E3G6R2_ENTLS|nr:diguanylate cyclase [[Enterobacter] lignolyticus]ADO48482.1 diguanylate cyclase with PAS/PAC sensor [[Enterobacter] lignolyticus SCF1]